MDLAIWRAEYNKSHARYTRDGGRQPILARQRGEAIPTLRG